MQTPWGHRSREDEAPLPAPCCSSSGWGGARSLPVLWDAPPVSPSPSFSSIFHSSCFLHKAGVSRDSSQMFSAAHHIAFLMKYSCSLSAFRRESLLQLPALETLRRQHSCKAAHPGLPAPPLDTFVLLLLPLPPRTSSAGAEASSPLALQARHHQEPRAGVTGVLAWLSPTPRWGSVGGWEGWQVGAQPSVGHGRVSPTSCHHHPGGGRAGARVCRCGPGAAAAPSQPAALAMLCTIIQLGCLCKQSGFMFR